ncbi:MAG: prenyltransferase/squalene oxidase repeat-containing protein [Planctomycetota bacterium]
MRNAAFFSLPALAVLIPLLPAQGEQPERPIRFTTFPVADSEPVDPAAATAQGLQVLLQLAEGEDAEQWPYEGVYREDGGKLPVGYRVGGTSIACLAMIAAPGLSDDAARQQALHKGVAFVLRTLDHPRMTIDFQGGYDVRGWGHIYALTLFLHLQGHGLVPKDLHDAVRDKTAWLVQALCESAIPESGGWNYSRRPGYRSPRSQASTFMTAPALQALFQAKARGHEVADAVLDQALDALERARSAPGGYAYGAPRTSQNDVEADDLGMMDRVGGSAARATAVETTLLLAGRGDRERHRRAVHRFFEFWDDLAVRKSQRGTHIEPYGIAPYYFLFGHVYAAQAIELLADEGERDALRAKMRAYLARSRDADGSWNDRHFDRSAAYGTAMAILALQMPNLPAPVARPASVAQAEAGSKSPPPADK